MNITFVLIIVLACSTLSEGFVFSFHGKIMRNRKGYIESMDQKTFSKILDKKLEIEMKNYRNMFKNMDSWMRKRF